MRNLWIFFYLTIYLKTVLCETDCDKEDDCHCMPGNTLELQCPRTFRKDDIGLVIHIKKREKLSIRCSKLKTFPMNFLPNVTLTETSILYLNHCPPPSENFRIILDHFSLTRLEVLQFEQSTINLTKKSFEGLQGLDRLKLNALKVQSVESNVFDGVPNLDSLEMERNTNLTLEAHIFDNLQKLNSLYLANNDLEEIADGLFRNLSNLTILHLWNNNLRRIERSTFLGLSNLGRLILNSNRINNISGNAFEQLIHLFSLDLSGNDLRNLSPFTFRSNKKLEIILMGFNHDLTLPDYLFANLPSLKEVDLTRCNLDSIPDHIFENSTTLEVLRLNNNKLKELSVETLTNLKVLILEKNLFSSVDNTFKDLVNLEELNLARNHIRIIDFESFSHKNKLRTLYLERNQFSGNFMKMLERTPNIEIVNMSHNFVTEMYDVFSADLPKLRILDLSHNNISNIKMMDFKGDNDLGIILNNNRISVVSFDKNEIRSSEKSFISLANNPIACDCNNYDFLDHLKRKNSVFQTENLECGSPFELEGQNLASLSPWDFSCQLNKPTTQECLYLWRPFDTSIIIDCSNKNFTEFPQINSNLTTPYAFNQTEMNLKGNNLVQGPESNLFGYDNVTKLYLSYNRIENIEWLPPNLQILELNNNTLSHLNRNVVHMLNKSRFENLTLKHNLWRCDCDAVHFADFLRKFSKVVDVDNIYCSTDPRRLLVNLHKLDLCSEWQPIYFLPLTLLILLTITVLSALYYQYPRQVFGRCIPDRKLDKDKIYDAFITYSHKDEDFVSKTLAPVLQSGPNPYKLCLHYRNWIPGESISTQVTKSVVDSRRTLVVLSPNFLESDWGNLEFRTAHTQAVSEGRIRVIIVLYEEVDEDKLKGDLKYLKKYTLVKWGDPDFWEKLKNAMPERKDEVANEQKTRNVISSIGYENEKEKQTKRLTFVPSPDTTESKALRV